MTTCFSQFKNAFLNIRNAALWPLSPLCPLWHPLRCQWFQPRIGSWIPVRGNGDRPNDGRPSMGLVVPLSTLSATAASHQILDPWAVPVASLGSDHSEAEKRDHYDAPKQPPRPVLRVFTEDTGCQNRMIQYENNNVNQCVAIRRMPDRDRRRWST